MVVKFCCCSFIILKIVDFKVGNNILWKAKIAHERIIFINLLV